MLVEHTFNDIERVVVLSLVEDQATEECINEIIYRNVLHIILKAYTQKVSATTNFHINIILHDII